VGDGGFAEDFGGREPMYEKADASVNTSGKTVKQAASELTAA